MMSGIDDAAILKRARELCERDGIAWEFSRTARLRRTLDDAGRREYLARAREQLLKEQNNA